MTLDFGPQLVSDLDAAATREWLVADGTGGYAMGTVAGLRTRRYHGLLVVATDPPGGRRLGLVSLDPVLVLGDRRVGLATHEWRSGAIAPNGTQLRTTFALRDGVPTWRWAIGAVVLQAEVAMLHGRGAVGVVHRCIAADRAVDLELEALTTWRDVHGETDATHDPVVTHDASGFVHSGAYRVAGPGWIPEGTWYRGVHHREEAARGLPADEDLWCAGRFRARLVPGDALEVRAWALAPRRADLPRAVADVPPSAVAIVDAARSRTQAVCRVAWRSAAYSATTEDAADAVLVHAADQHVAAGSVVAGYPWFGAWSRDTLASHRGLFLETGRAAEGRAVLQRVATTLADGLLANTTDTGARRDNAVDAPLWLVHAVRAHVDATGDHDLAAELLHALEGVVRAYEHGTAFGIGVDARGLVRAAAPGEALTWMDARIDGVAVTPRAGAPVEVQALWVSALGSIAHLRELLSIDATAMRAAHLRARAACAAFVSPASAVPVDVFDMSGRADRAVRPNALFAVSLVDGPFAGDDTTARRVLDACLPLVTPLGLRSLGPDQPSYVGRHRGDPTARDRAYHQGTVWPWLVGAYVDAVLALAPERRGPHHGLAVATVECLVAHLGDHGLGSVSETADGDAPHGATGCPFQAWSVAELLRARRRLRDRRRPGPRS